MTETFEWWVLAWVCVLLCLDINDHRKVHAFNGYGTPTIHTLSSYKHTQLIRHYIASTLLVSVENGELVHEHITCSVFESPLAWLMNRNEKEMDVFAHPLNIDFPMDPISNGAFELHVEKKKIVQNFYIWLSISQLIEMWLKSIALPVISIIVDSMHIFNLLFFYLNNSFSFSINVCSFCFASH